MDVWSLFATIADVHRKFSFSPTQAKSYADVLHAMRAAALAQPNLADMVQENPHHRALAAQLLAAHFGGRGFSTPRAQVPPLSPPPTTPKPSTAAVAPSSVPASQAPTIAPTRAPVAFRWWSTTRTPAAPAAGRGTSTVAAIIAERDRITKTKAPATLGRPPRRPAPAQAATRESSEDRNERPGTSVGLLSISGTSRSER